MVQATTITLETVRAAIKVTQTYDDGDLQRLLNSATQEALRYLNRRELPTLPFDYPADIDGDCISETVTEQTPSSEDAVAPDVENAIILLIKADYEGDPLERPKYRTAAEALLTPYRIGWGV